MMLKVGITGGIGTGKSIVCNLFAVLGVPIYNADMQAKALVIANQNLKNAIIAAFGTAAYLPNGEYNRKLISEIVFNDSQALATLNKIIHPYVFQDFDDWCAIQQHEAYIVKEAALMIESGSHLQNDYTILVIAPLAQRLKNIAKRDGLLPAQIDKIIANQLPESEKVPFADFIIQNDESHSLIEQVLAIHHQLINQ
jgi:dephospho-CoA kinase